MRVSKIGVALSIIWSSSVFAITPDHLMPDPWADSAISNVSDMPDHGTPELDPFDPEDHAIIDDQDVQDPHGPFGPLGGLLNKVGGCMGKSCPVYVHVSMAKPETLYLYEDGVQVAAWPASTGKAGHLTPSFFTNPGTNISTTGYCSSNKYHGGNYIETDPKTGLARNLGNMPYCVEVHGGFYIHGTADIGDLGHPASHGCIRIHPAHAKQFNRLVREVGIDNVWIQID